MKGKIIKGIAGFYYVRKEDAGGEASGAGCCGNAAGRREPEGRNKSWVYECKARGVFRKDHRKPLVGDDVELDVLDEGKRLGNISRLLPRRSELIRPAVANVDQALVIFSIVKPNPNFNLLDRFLIMMGRQGLPCVICFNKQDLDGAGEGQRYAQIYAGCGYEALTVSARKGEGIEALKGLLAGKTTVIAGPSGVGKSTVVNLLQPEIVMETGQISEKIERGKHTTRHSELIAMGENTYILDTPGFSSLELFSLEKEQLSACYPEFKQEEGHCRFVGCSHVTEPDCGVKKAVGEGRISKMRYDNYCLLYGELKNKRRY